MRLIIPLILIIVVSLFSMFIFSEFIQTPASDKEINITKRINSCKYGPKVYEKDCFIRLGNETGDASVCENIDDIDHRYDCYLMVAFYTSNISVCKFLPRTDDRSPNIEPYNDCMALAKQTLNDTSQCLLLEDEIEKDLCIVSVAFNTKDLNICSAIKSNISETCIWWVAVAKNDTSLCLQIEDSDHCILDISMWNPKTEHCEFIKEDKWRFNCIMNVKERDVEVSSEDCEGFKDDEYRKACIAYADEDIEKCQEINNTEIKNDCIRFTDFYLTYRK